MSASTEHPRRRTKIVCTIGPATNTPEKLAALMKAGMDVARLNFSHGTRESHAADDRAHPPGQQLARAAGRILQDLPGPKTRTVGAVRWPGRTLRRARNLS